MIVIEPPNAIRTSKAPSNKPIAISSSIPGTSQNPCYHGMVILLLDDSQLSQAVQPRRAVGLVAGTVIYSARVPEAIGEVRDDIDRSGLEIGR
nr:hypothetical protein CFP56_18953 [Quercus suber]